VRLTSVEPNGPVTRSEFTFVVPKGVKVIDQTTTPE
jgi:outer membrane lipoprotein-sorting protein